jgi:hypothetical protein
MSGVPWRIITGSGLDYWIYWHFYYNDSKLQVTAHNWRLPKTRSIPSWTTSVFSSIMTGFWYASRPLFQLPSTLWLTLHSWNSLRMRISVRLLSPVQILRLNAKLLFPWSGLASFVASGEQDRNRRLKGFHYCCTCMRCVGNMCNSAATVC